MKQAEVNGRLGIGHGRRVIKLLGLTHTGNLLPEPGHAENIFAEPNSYS